jgi:hypothetical protein
VPTGVISAIHYAKKNTSLRILVAINFAIWNLIVIHKKCKVKSIVNNYCACYLPYFLYTLLIRVKYISIHLVSILKIYLEFNSR